MLSGDPRLLLLLLLLLFRFGEEVYIEDIDIGKSERPVGRFFDALDFCGRRVGRKWQEIRMEERKREYYTVHVEERSEISLSE